MRWILGTAVVASVVISGISDSNAQVCTTTTVRAGYLITTQSGWRYSCCQGFNYGGTCRLRSCKVGLSGASLTSGGGPRYQYDRSFEASNCLGSRVN
jgi:hypothetical protein